MATVVHRVSRRRLIAGTLATGVLAAAAVAARRDPPGRSGAPVSGATASWRRIPTTPRRFTQGLAVADGVLYEGTGLDGASTLRRVDLATGEVRRRRPRRRPVRGGRRGRGRPHLPADLGTGTASSTTARRSRCWRRSPTGRGLGARHGRERLIMSDGTDRLVVRDPATFAVVGAVAVRDGDAPVAHLNELE